MTITARLLQSLGEEVGWVSTSPQTIHVTDTEEQTLDLDVTSVDRQSCSFRELRFYTPALNQCTASELKRASDEICGRVTYLLEKLALLEFDPYVGEALIRSEKPDQRSSKRRYYEVQISHEGMVALRRYEFAPHSPRTRIDLQATHELLEKLVPDLVAATQVATQRN